MSHSIAERGHGRRGIRSLRHAKLAATDVKPIAGSGLDVTRHGAKAGVDPPEQINQCFPLILSKTGQQPALALQRRDNHFVVGGTSFARQRNRVAAAVARIGLDRDQVALFHHGQSAADRALVEADDVTDARGGNAWLDCEQRHDPPFRDIDAEALLVEYRGTARQLIGDECDEGGNVALEIERLARFGAAGSLLPSGRVGRSVLAHISYHPRKRVVEK